MGIIYPFLLSFYFYVSFSLNACPAVLSPCSLTRVVYTLFHFECVCRLLLDISLLQLLQRNAQLLSDTLSLSLSSLRASAKCYCSL